MASLGHLAAGLAAGKAMDGDGRRVRPRAATVYLTALSFLPDADVIAFPLGIAYSAPFGHRGATHSLSFAIVMALLSIPLARRFAVPTGRFALAAGLVTLSHVVLDMMTDGGLGVALWWPLETTRHFLPWRPIPVAPIGGDFLSARGLWVASVELVIFLPVFIWALWRPRRKASADAQTGRSGSLHDVSSDV